MDIFCTLYIFIYKKFFIGTVIYIGCLILKVAPKYFFSEAFSEKMFQTKVVWVKGGGKMVPL